MGADKTPAAPTTCFRDPTMTTKAKILRVIESLDADASVDDAIDRLYLLRKIELGIAQAAAEDVVEHEQFMEELEAENAE